MNKRQERRHRRFLKRKEKLNVLKNIIQEYRCTLGQARHYYKRGYFEPWEDSNSPTGYTQYCEYFHTCQYPCNGDC